MSTCTYDPLQLAQRQSAEVAALRQRGGADELEQVRTALKCLEWIEYAEESMIKAENDCLVEYSEEMHRSLHELYADWLRQFDNLLQTCSASTAAAGSEKARLFSSLVAAKQRVQEWLQAQADIVRHTLAHADLSALAAAANLSAGNRSPHATP